MLERLWGFSTVSDTTVLSYQYLLHCTPAMVHPLNAGGALSKQCLKARNDLMRWCKEWMNLNLPGKFILH